MRTVSGYDELFEKATGNEPFPWQRQLALRPEPAKVVAAPTGSGKTEAVLLDWLWRRLFHPEADERDRTPRRLVIALPMRVLVEQTIARMNSALSRLHDARLLARPVRAYPLMGGMADDSWALRPEEEAVLVGTIDMLVSRALNRGFGRYRSSWPIDFGLVNSDSLWIFDEIQLMDAAVATSCQMEAFRERFAVAAPSRTVWMSATLELSWLRTVDHEPPDVSRLVGVGDDDRRGELGLRLAAPKEVERAEIDPADADAFARRILEEHDALADVADAPRLTLALANTVHRAIEVHRALAKLTGGERSGIDCVLLHSRFRPADRERLVRRLGQTLEENGRIVVSTQAIEAGVDLDAGALVTELAPWPSLVQRAGRLNRSGQRQSSPARFIWLDPPAEALERLAKPYETETLETARQALADLEGGSFSPDSIAEYATEKGAATLLGNRTPTLFLRAPDLLDLFDTDPTLDGDNSDVGRYIRLGEDLDVGVVWRDFGDDPNDPQEPSPDHDEVCPVPVWERRQLVDLRPWRWSYARRRWDRISPSDDLVPGDLLLLRTSVGGYSTDVGWTGRKGDPVIALRHPESMQDGDSDIHEEKSPGRWITLEDHTRHVIGELDQILPRLDLESEWVEALRLAARVHDAGKAHGEFQYRLRRWANEERDDDVYAKSPERRRWRPPFAFRHELVSALLLLERGNRSRELDLAAFLVAAHHGKFRLTPRLLPDDHRPDRLVCLGVGEGDAFPHVMVAGEAFGPATLDLSLLRIGDLGQATWIERALDLLDRLGPFRLAYLEALLRAADQRASAREKEEVPD